MIVPLIKAMRPHQWVKNTFVFAGILFSGRLFNPDDIITVIIGFAIFCMAASGVYLFNDSLDKEKDKLHPKKKNRPIASGQIPVWLAIGFAVLLWSVGLLWAFTVDIEFGFLIAFYILLHIIYTILLKQVVIWDLMFVSAGFVLRAVGGAIILNVDISSWLLVCTSLLSLFLITAKRRAELVNVSDTGSTRPVLKKYSVDFLNALLLVLIASTLTSYTLYVFSDDTIAHIGSRAMGFSIPFVFYGLFRYLYLIMFLGKGESPERTLFTDKAFLLNIVMWTVSVVLSIYWSQIF